MKRSFKTATMLMLFGFMMFLSNNGFAQQAFDVDATTKLSLKEHYQSVFSHQIPEYRFERFILPTSKNEFYWTRVRDRRLELNPNADVTTLNTFINHLSENIPAGK